MKTFLFLLLISVSATAQQGTLLPFTCPTLWDSGLIRLDKPTYTVLYDPAANGPRLVAWHLDRKDLGHVQRYIGPFIPDRALPDSLYHVRHRDYQNTGYDRGHMCNSADRRATMADQQSAFLLTNILPQSPRLNRELWESLEQWTRRQVLKGNEAYIVAGGAGTLGVLPGTAINIPAVFVKIIYLLPEGDNDQERIAQGKAKIVAVRMPNNRRVWGRNWKAKRYQVSVAIAQAELGCVCWVIMGSQNGNANPPVTTSHAN